jgi:DNA-binding LacI/PurR family transcriptional regulator
MSEAQGKNNLSDVAKSAGVSLTTASLVLSDSGRISAQTRQRVLDAALSLGYRHKGKKNEDSTVPSRNIAVLLDFDLEWEMALVLVRPVIQELDTTLRQAGYNTIIIPISTSESTTELLEKIRCSHAIGVATLHFASPELILLLESADIPVVVVMNSNFQDRFYTVCADDFQGAYEGACYLIRLGHLCLGYVDCVRPDLAALPVDRFFGFKKAIEEYHLEYEDSLRIRLCLEDDEADGLELAKLVREHPGMSAIFAMDDELALRIVSLLGKQGLSVPKDLSILAPGDMADYSQGYMPQITTMRIDTTYMGRISAQMLISRITHNPQEPQVLKVKQRLVHRESVRDIR